MALTTRPPLQERPIQRIWKTPGSKVKWICLAASLILYSSIYAWYLHALKTQPYIGPDADPWRLFGIIAFCLVVVVATYTLRRRFAHRLPGKVQNWLWIHTWLGVISILIAFLHENYVNILHDYSFTLPDFSGAAYGMSALYALIFLVISGIIGRLLDIWAAHVIAAEANSNGTGIVQAVEEKLLELELTVERYSAGKSAAFKLYRSEALGRKASLPEMLPVLAPEELDDFERVYEVLKERASLGRSLQRQKRARLIIQAWRYVHIPLACAALAVIAYHGVSELLMMVLH